MKKRFLALLVLIFVLMASMTSCLDSILGALGGGEDKSYLLEDVPDFDGKTAYVLINENKPFFEESEIVTDSYEKYSPLDALGRCGAAVACIGVDLMPTEDRGSIGQVKPSGWHTVKYDIVDGKYLYNRCHLIGYQLTGENANKGNLITGTRYLNIQGMLDFENMVADYIKETKNHVMYRVTPIFEGNNLLATGVLMEAYSVEDSGAGIEFCIYAYNAQPGVSIDYKNGNSVLSGEKLPEDNDDEAPEIGGEEAEGEAYVINISSKKFHKPDCSGVKGMSESNRVDFVGVRDELIEAGYSPCGTCKP